ncbi:MAG: dTMP kinase [Rhodospirillales bacterium]|mgnify:CR=1 FL=1|nr:dTMP kinase [Alphaproteobacteria bacterium]USO06204.1 MAG: dTMP kinase [Rhodospirillales bacterium]
MHKGLFITFEGGEGSGKTTQINRLAHTLSQTGQKILTTREPGGTPEGEKIRNLLVQREGGNWTPTAEILLLFAARVMHVEKIIKPALEDNKIVICDRFTDSTIAYQGYGHSHNIDSIEKIGALSLGDFGPDLTIILDIDPEEGLRRSDRRLAAEQFNVKEREDRYEQLDIEFHKRLRRGFLEIAGKEPERCHVIPAMQDIDVVSNQIADIVREKIAR